jgi:flagellar motor switch protein FliM
MDRVLSQEEIDNVFREQRHEKQEEPGKKAVPYDFRRPDRIAKDQLRSIHLLHENFARNLSSSLSAYLRAYVLVSLISVEQLSYVEFSEGIPSPTCLASLTLKPYDGNAVLELGPTLVFPILEMLLGGSGKVSRKIDREVTEIEQSILQGVYRIVLHDLKEAWRGVTNIEFTIDKHETDPQLLQILSPNEAVVVIGMEIRIGENTGAMNLGLPSIFIKMLRQRFDQQWTMRKSESTAEEQGRILRLIKPARIHAEARLDGPTLPVEALMELEEGDLLKFDYPVDRPLALLLNGKVKYKGHLATTGRKKIFAIEGAP